MSDTLLAAARRNRLLRSLPPSDLRAIGADSHVIDMRAKQVLHDSAVPIPHVHFLLGGVVSITMHAPGGVIEVATVGYEGFVGLPVFLGDDSYPGRAFCQIPGQALVMDAGTFRAAVATSGALSAALQRYTLALFGQIAQASACNRLHPVAQRCCRWLLMTHDRAGADEFPMTQEFLASMLGVRRATVTEAARELASRRLIRYSRGVLTVLDRHGLEAAACDCYGIVAAEYDRLLG